MRQDSWRRLTRGVTGERVSEGLLITLVIGSALAMGALHVQSGLVVCALAGVAASLALLRGGGAATPLPALLMLALAAYSTVQTVPLPLDLLRHVAPRAADVWTQTTTTLGHPASSASISYDPGASAVAAAHWFSYACVFVAAASIGARRGSAWGALLLLGSASLIGLITFVHGLTQASTVYGFYTPTFGPSRWHIGPLLNPNTLAGYLNLGAFCGLGLALSRRPALPRWLLASAVAILFSISVLSGSRGGVLAIPAGLVLLAVLHRRARQRETQGSRLGRGEWVVLVAPALGGIALAALGSTSLTWQELLQRNVDKLQLAGWTVPLVRDHLWLGIGRGAFESVFQQYRTGSDNLIYSHPENVIVQWVVEWGIVVGGAGLAAVAYSLRASKLNVGTQSAATGVGVGALLLALQNLVDLSLEVPAVALALAAGLGGCWGAARSRRAPPKAGWLPGAWAPAACLAVTVLVTLHAAGRGMHPVAHNRLQVHQQLQALSPQTPQSVAALRNALTAAMLRHPAEPYFPRLRAVLALQHGGEPVLKWIDLALTLAPWSGRTHLVLATALARGKGPSHQTLLELRLAAEYDPGLALETGRIAVTVTQDAHELERAAPAGPTGARVLLAMTEQLSAAEQRPVRLQLLKTAVGRDPSYLPPRLALVEDLLSGNNCDATPDCDRIFDEQLAGIDASSGPSSVALELRARRLLTSGRVPEAEEALARGCSAFKERFRCLALRLNVAQRLGDAEVLLDASKALTEHACAGERCLSALLASGRALQKAGLAVPALGYFERAATEQPSVETLTAVATVAKDLGLFSRAEGALARASRMKGADPDARRKLDEQRRQRWLLQLGSGSQRPLNPPPALRNQ